MTEDDNDHEEEFYYNEVEVPMAATAAAGAAAVLPHPVSEVKPVTNPSTLQQMNRHHTHHPVKSHQPIIAFKPCLPQQQQQQQQSLARFTVAGSSPTILVKPSHSQQQHQAAAALMPVARRYVLSDHMDMARPPHENPEYRATTAHLVTAAAAAGTTQVYGNDGRQHKHLLISHHGVQQGTGHHHQLGPPPGAAPVPITIPVSHLALSSSATSTVRLLYCRLSRGPH